MAIQSKRDPWLISLIVLVIWLVIVVCGQLLQTGGGTSLGEMVTRQIVISLIVAPLFLFAGVAYFKWWRQVGLQAPSPWRSLFLLWLLALFLIAFLGLAIARGLPPRNVIQFVLINSLLVAVSEELMFRGMVFYIPGYNGVAWDYVRPRRLWPHAGRFQSRADYEPDTAQRQVFSPE